MRCVLKFYLRLSSIIVLVMSTLGVKVNYCGESILSQTRCWVSFCLYLPVGTSVHGPHSSFFHVPLPTVQEKPCASLRCRTHGIENSRRAAFQRLRRSKMPYSCWPAWQHSIMAHTSLAHQMPPADTPTRAASRRLTSSRSSSAAFSREAELRSSQNPGHRTARGWWCWALGPAGSAFPCRLSLWLALRTGQ